MKFWLHSKEGISKKIVETIGIVLKNGESYTLSQKVTEQARECDVILFNEKYTNIIQKQNYRQKH